MGSAKSTASSKPQPADDEASLPDFEASIGELDGLVAKLENGDLPLADALAAYGRGVQLAGACQKALDAAEQRVTVLGQDGAAAVSAAADSAAADSAAAVSAAADSAAADKENSA